jgi:2-polyprenyl-3-methyl-5-hydroxy-6-metoxy-1,4-benzoquinol methylase
MPSTPKNVTKLIDTIIGEHPLHKEFMKTALEQIQESEFLELESYLDFCAKKGLKIAYLAKCYLTIVEDSLAEQIYFMRHKEYRFKTLKEVGDQVYFDPDYMNLYMYGLALTGFLWPNHLSIVRFFKKTLPLEKTGAYLEVGPGHGHFMMTAMETGSFNEFLGVDISETSIEQTRSIINHFSHENADKVRLEVKDFLAVDDLPDESFDAIVMGEVLEHVEDPGRFLLRIAQLAKPDAHIYITTCINAPAIDHIFLWRTIEALELLITDCDLTVRDKIYLPYMNKTLEESKEENLPINVAYVLAKGC